MKQIIQSYRIGELAVAPYALKPGHILAQTAVSAIRLGTEGKKVAARGMIQVRCIGKNGFCKR